MKIKPKDGQIETISFKDMLIEIFGEEAVNEKILQNYKEIKKKNLKEKNNE